MNSFGRCGGGGRRLAAREAAPLIAVFTTTTQSHSAVVADLSSTGARLRGESLPQPRDEFLLSIESVRVFGIVRWSNGEECGVAFDEPLPSSDLEMLRAKVVRGLTPEMKAAMDDWTLGVAR